MAASYMRSHTCTHPPTPVTPVLQEYLMKLPNRMRKLAERASARKAKSPPTSVKVRALSRQPFMLSSCARE